MSEKKVMEQEVKRLRAFISCIKDETAFGKMSPFMRQFTLPRLEEALEELDFAYYDLVEIYNGES